VTAYLSEDERMLDGVRLSSGRIISARMALCAVGVRPSTGFLQDSGIVIDQETGAIPVNTLMQTSVPDIYAAGNCAVYNGMISRHWATAAEQGLTAGLNMVGNPMSYQALAVGEGTNGVPLILEEMAVNAPTR
jgi:NAD(P)H-nitrite reductase large subunit